MSSTTSPVTAALPARKRHIPGRFFAIPGIVLVIAGYFLPWLAFIANETPFLVLSGRETAAGGVITTGTGADLFHPSSISNLALIVGVIALVVVLLAWRRGYSTEWGGLILTSVSVVAFVVIWLRVTGAQELAENAGVALRYSYGLIAVFLGLFTLIVAGIQDVRTASERKPSLRGVLGAWGFMSTAVFLIVVFFLVPVFLLLVLSLTDLSSSNFSDPWHFVGLQNYIRIFNDRFFPKILGNTFRYVILTLGFFNVGMALVLALLTSHISRRAGFFFRVLWLLPRITPSVVYIVMWRRFVQLPPYGIINQFLNSFGVEYQPYWLNEAPWFFVVLVNGFVGASFGMIIFSSAIEAIPKDVITAAKVDGASAWQIIRDITLPLLKWPLLFVTTYQTLSLLVSFEYILLLTDGGPGLYNTEVWSLTAYHRALRTYFGSNQWGYGAAWGFVLVIIGAILAFIYLRVFRFDDLVQEPKIDIL
ncbi:MAG: carbohydrate ABC transporter permease [Anaerolineae bacterium]